MSPQYRDLCQAIDRWTSTTGVRLPTIIPASALCLLSGFESGFPSSALIEPLMPWILALVDRVRRSSERAGRIFVSKRMTALFKTNNLPFVRRKDTFWYSYSVGMAKGTCQCGWILNETKQVYQSLKEECQNEIILRDEKGNYTGDAQPVIFTECHALLERFNPREWASNLERVVKINNLKHLGLIRFRPHNMVWAQIVLLDVAIHFLVRGGFYTGPPEMYNLWPKEVVAVFNAIIGMWDPSLEHSANEVKDATQARSSKQPTPPPPKAVPIRQPEYSDKQAPSPLITELQEPGLTLPGETTPMTIEAPQPLTRNRLLVFEEEQSSEKASCGEEEATTTGDPILPSPDGSPRASKTFHTRTPPLPELSRPSTSKRLRFSAVVEFPPVDDLPLDVNWELEENLRKQADLFADVAPAERRDALVRRLTDLLQLRIVFVLALFLLAPDSSDVYFALGESGEMPMI